MAAYEVEIKALLGEKKNAERLKVRMHELDPQCVCTRSYTQLNHYFKDGSPEKLFEVMAPHFSDDTKEALREIAHQGRNISVRTREMNGEVRFVMKAAVDETTSENGIARLEFEEPVSLSLGELDALVREAGYTYQAKWSRTREEYDVRDVHVCLDKNAGYGYLVEFEKVIDTEEAVPAAREEVLHLMSILEVEELPQDRLARMFEFYNKNWPEYYGTENVFVIE